MTDVEQRLTAVRASLASEGYDALIVPRADQYLGEYLPAHNERLKWITGFNGSAGLVLILRDKAAIFVDGRYTVQVRSEVPESLFEYHHLLDEPPVAWLSTQLSPGARVACDPRLHSRDWYRQTRSTLSDGDLELIADTDNLIDRCWNNRPEPVISPAVLHPLRYSGESSVDKRARIGQTVQEQGADAALIFAPDSVSWLLNIRGTDIPCLPVVQSFAMLRSNGSLTLFVDAGRVPAGFFKHVGEGVDIEAEDRAEEVLRRYQGQRVLVDAAISNAWTVLALEAAGATVLAGSDPVLLPKAGKNPVEIQGARIAHIRDAVAEVKFLAWLDGEVDAGCLHDEAYLSDKLYSFRKPGELFRGSSFNTISAAGANAAICHYNHMNAVPAQLAMNSVYLVDSGAQYSDGTTDITRTVAIGDPGDEVRRLFTLVLKGHIALARARFPTGTSGGNLDALARQFLWRGGFDFDHGTGHGVGSFLSVHEGPQRIAKQNSLVPLCPGMIISNEPGYYRDGEFGIRCENLVVVQEVPDCESSMLEFETITLVPFDNRLLTLSLMDTVEIDWLNAYHLRVRETLAPRLEGDVLEWLLQATGPLAR